MSFQAKLPDNDSAAKAEDKKGQETSHLDLSGDEDVAQNLEMRELFQAEHDVDQPCFADIDRASRKSELGTYGLPDEWGNAIPQSRLDASPRAVLTLDEAATKGWALL